MGDCAKKGQTGIELMSGLGLLIIVFMFILILTIHKTSESSRIKTTIDAKRITESIKDNINMISQQGKGYYRYFSLPKQIKGGYAYEVAASDNVVEVLWEDNAYTMTIIAHNLTIHCLSYNESQTNRIYNRGNAMEVTCWRPNMLFDPETAQINETQTSVHVINDGPTGSDYFWVRFTNTSETVQHQVAPMQAYERLILRYNSTDPDYCIKLDYGEVVNESIEEDNMFGGGCT